MATADMGLFGPSPWEIQQAQQQQIDTKASNFARMSPFEKAGMMMYQGGAGLAGAVAPMFGGVNVAQQQAAQQQEAMQGADLQTPDGLRAVAKKMLDMGNQKSAYLLAQKAAALEKVISEENYKKAQTAQQEAMAKKLLAEAAAKEKEDGLKNLPPEVQAMMKLQSMDPNSPGYTQLKAWLDKKMEGKGDWSEPFNLAGATVQKNTQTGEIRTAVARPPVTKVSVGEDKSSQQQTPQLKPADLLRLRQSMGKDRSAVTQTEADTDELSKKIDSLVSNDSGLSGITGVQGMVPNYPGGQAAIAQSDLDSIKAKFMAMGRTLQSQQGKLGNMAVQEWKFIQDMVGNLNTNAGKEKLTQNLNEAKTYLDGLSKRMRGTYEDVYAPYADQLETLSLPERKPPTPPGEPKQTDKFVVGKQYKDAKGNVATYQGNGQWK